MQTHHVLIEAMVVGAVLGGGLTARREELILTMVVEDEAFGDLEEVQVHELFNQVTEMCAQLDAAGGLLRLQERGQSDLSESLMRMLSAVALCDDEPGDALHQAGKALGLGQATIDQILSETPALIEALQVSPTLEEIYLDVLLAAAVVDGSVAEEELNALIEYARSCSVFAALPRAEIEDMMDASLRGFLDHGIQSWLEGLPEAIPETSQRQTAYRMASEMIRADNEVLPSEAEFMRLLQQALSLETEWVNSLPI